jgi:hypothetical protein
MQRILSGRRPALKAVSRAGLLSLGLILSAGLAACTTTEGTNAFADIRTFEREVAIETMKGMGMIEREQKDENIQPRGPLVLPKNATLPPPVDTKADRTASLLPEDSGNVKIDTRGLSQADMTRLRNARVVDLQSVNGRPLTDEETKKLTAKFSAAQLKGGPRPLYLPPEEYFTTVKGKDTVCLAANGELVPLDDPACPPAIRKALAKQSR